MSGQTGPGSASGPKAGPRVLASRFGLAGADIFGSGFSVDIVVHPGAGAYICGDICDNIVPGVTWPPAQTTICPLGPSIPCSVASGIRMFRDEFLEHVRLGRCPFPPDRLPRSSAVA